MIRMIVFAAFIMPLRLPAQDTIRLAADKTSSLIFPFAILHIDRGTRDVLVQQLKEKDNIMLVKAACPEFHATNLSVLTEDGSLYTFLVCYDSLPDAWVYRLPVQQKIAVQTYANSLLDNPALLRKPADKSMDMRLALDGIYVKDKLIFCRFTFTNTGPLDYDVDYLRFYLRDKRIARRTARQEIEIKPVLIAGNQREVPAYSQKVFVVVVEKFTIPDARIFIAEAGERNGGRHLSIVVRNTDLLKAVVLPDLK